MHLVTYQHPVAASARLGALVDGELVADVQRLAQAQGIELPAQMLDFIDLGPAAQQALRRLLDSDPKGWPPQAVQPLANVRLLAPIPRPRVVKQQSNTRHMLFKVPQLIADISAGITLEPGDIIATGTPAGVGAGRSPQEWLWPGDVVTAGVQGVGTQRHPVVAS